MRWIRGVLPDVRWYFRGLAIGKFVIGWMRTKKPGDPSTTPQLEG